MKVKVLIACDVDTYGNPYVGSLYQGLLKNGCDVVCSISEFLENPLSYNIIHIQWPHALVEKGQFNSISDFENHIKMIKQNGIRIISTCHNISPHYSNNKMATESYKIVYSNADVIVHLGDYSVKELEKKGIESRHVIIPHHTFDTVYNLNASREEARKYLRIPQNKKVVLCFGAFRDEEERMLVINAANALNDEFLFLVPGFFIGKIFRKNVIKGLKDLCGGIYNFYRARRNGLKMHFGYVPNNEIKYYVCASDMLFLQRVRILNSGNIILGLLAGLPILGPNSGNVGSLLMETGNYVFDIDNLSEIPDLIKKCCDDTELGKKNKQYAANKLSTDIIAKKYIQLYNSLVK